VAEEEEDWELTLDLGWNRKEPDDGVSFPLVLGSNELLWLREKGNLAAEFLSERLEGELLEGGRRRKERLERRRGKVGCDGAGSGMFFTRVVGGGRRSEEKEEDGAGLKSVGK